MESVPDEDFATFAKIIMNSGPYKTGKLDLADLLKTYIAHITSEKPFNVSDILWTSVRSNWLYD